MSILRALYSLKSENNRTLLSFFWWFLAPTIDIAVLYFVFSILLGNKTEGFLFVLSIGVLYFNWFSTSVNNAANALVGQRHIVINTNISLYSLVLSSNLSDLIKQLLVLFVFLFLVAWQYNLSGSIWVLGITLIAEFTFIYFFSLIVAIIIPLIPDLRLILNVIIQLMVFSSGVFFSAGNVPVEYQKFFFYNPLANIIELNRIALIPNYVSSVSISEALLSLALSVTCILFLSCLIYKSFKVKVRKVI